MDNTVGRYEPDNELFRTLVLMVLCFIFNAFYTLLKLDQAGHFDWYDWIVTGLVTAAMARLYVQTQKKLK